jgi:hypothetical protein
MPQGRKKKKIASQEHILAGPVNRIKRWHRRKKKKF